MAKKRYKVPSQNKWASTYADFSGIYFVATKEMDLVRPIVNLIMTGNKIKLEIEYQQYCKRHYPVVKSSKWDWIKEYIEIWNRAVSKRDYAQKVLDRLNGIEDKNAWTGNNPPVVKEGKRC